jgi:predicted alpha/beta-fold hydrolase
MIDWRLAREGLRLLRDELQWIYVNHRRRVQVALVVALLSRAWKPWLRAWLLKLHAARHAAPPQLVYQPTLQNEQLLERCSVLRSTYHPPWYLSNGYCILSSLLVAPLPTLTVSFCSHLQTLYLGRSMRDKHPAIHYEREIVELPDGGIVSLDWALQPRAGDGAVRRLDELDPTARTMLILPGLTGGSDEFYIRSLAHEVLALGWQVVVLNARGCARTPLRTPQLFSCAHTGDLRFVLEKFRAAYAFPTLVTVGFSMGSNVLVKYLGEFGADALVTAAVSVGNPFDMVEASRTMQQSFLYRHTYYAALTQNLKKLFFHRSNAHEAFANHPQIDLDAVRNATGIDDFDEKLTCIVFGYKDAHEYYADASSSARIPLVRVPLLCINAEDDPISAPHAIPVEAIRQNDHVILCLTKGGGHLAFYEHDHEEQEDKDAPLRLWSSRAVAQFADSFHAAGSA